MLDDVAALTARDSEDTLGSAEIQAKQATMDLPVVNASEPRELHQVIITGMGGSALAAELVKSWLDSRLKVPLEIVRDYGLPNYVGEHTLVIASSCSGNTEETLSALADARQRGAAVGVVAKGGKLLEIAQNDALAYVQLPQMVIQPRMLTIAQVVALSNHLIANNIVGPEVLDELKEACAWLLEHLDQWKRDTPTEQNPAKQMALAAVGKNALFIGGPLMSAAAYKWKISWNESAKNVAFWNVLPEFSHNEFIGWSSHPIEKPFVVYDIVSDLEHPQVLKRFELTDKLLSGMRPKSTVIRPEGDTLLKQLLWVSLLADFVSIYLGLLNNVDPGPVPLVEKLKKEL